MSTLGNVDGGKTGGGITIPTVEECFNLDDFERAASVLLKIKAFAYYMSAGDDEKSK